ncbi:MAG: phosphoribosylamine--glycine ligase, partial [Clostridiales bacterium]|nr:phosphoribosylamine--glycine ligase [Clostridiales bacterium]
DGDLGPNTGGMGAYSPAPVYTRELASVVERDVLRATLDALKAEGIFFRGILYAGLMVTPEGPKVLEYNCRFGDPETQPVLFRLKTDLLEIIQAILSGELHKQKIEWHEEAAICVVMAATGYPGAYEKGREIGGLREAGEEGAVVFHAGTAMKEGRVVSSGGRVLGVTALAAELSQARQKAYDACARIDFPGGFYRKDIGYKAFNRE